MTKRHGTLSSVTPVTPHSCSSDSIWTTIASGSLTTRCSSMTAREIS